MILSELAKLKQYIEFSIREACVPIFSLPNIPDHKLDSHSRVARNLQSLARAAKVFHSTASTTASSMYRSSLGAAMPSFTRERIHGFIRDHNVSHVAPLARHTVTSRFESEWSFPPKPDAVEDSDAISASELVVSLAPEPDADMDLEILFFNGLEKRAAECVRAGNITKAELLLEQALSRHGDRQKNKGAVDRLQVQLSLCYIFLGKWRQAEPLIQPMVQSTSITSDSVISDLLHALAMAYMDALSLGEAMKLCKQALNIRKKLLGTTDARYHLTMGLLATIYDRRNETVYGDIIRCSMPSEFDYRHPKSIRRLIEDDLGLFKSVFGVENIDWTSAELVLASNPGHNIVGMSTEEKRAPDAIEQADSRANGQSSLRITRDSLLARTLKRMTTASSARQSRRLVKKTRHSEPPPRTSRSATSLYWNKNHNHHDERPSKPWFRLFRAPARKSISKNDIRMIPIEFPEFMVVVAPTPKSPSTGDTPGSTCPNPPLVQDTGLSMASSEINERAQGENGPRTEVAGGSLELPIGTSTVEGRPDSLTIPSTDWICLERAISAHPVGSTRGAAYQVPRAPPPRPTKSLPIPPPFQPFPSTAKLSPTFAQQKINADVESQNTSLRESSTPGTPLQLHEARVSKTPSVWSDCSVDSIFALLGDSDHIYSSSRLGSKRSSYATSIETSQSREEDSIYDSPSARNSAPNTLPPRPSLIEFGYHEPWARTHRSDCHQYKAKFDFSPGETKKDDANPIERPFLVRGPSQAKYDLDFVAHTKPWDNNNDQDLDELRWKLTAQSGGGKYLWSPITVEPSSLHGFVPFF